MKTLFKSFLLLAPLLSGVCIAYSQQAYSLKSFKMTVSGTSTMHDWTSDVTKLEWTGLILAEGKTVKEIKNVVVKIPVTSIKSTKGKTMDNKTYEAFKSDKNPTIQYKLMQISNNGADLQATGSLSMAGVTNSITLKVTAKVLTNGEVQITGTQKLKMTDYKMEQPTAVMGTIKVADEVTVNFDVTVTPSK